MLVSRHQGFAVKYIYVQMMRILREVSAHDGNKVVHLLLIGLAERTRRDGERVGDTIAAVGVAQLCNRVEEASAPETSRPLIGFAPGASGSP